MHKVQIRAQGLQRDGAVLLDRKQQRPRIRGTLRLLAGSSEEERL
jgi:hypothetical protein